jgi:hypothetical protein
LLELNSLSVGRLCPDDLLGVKGKLKLSDPFNGCYILTNENDNGLTVDVDKQLPGIIADFLYQKIIVTRTVPDCELAHVGSNGKCRKRRRRAGARSSHE